MVKHKILRASALVAASAGLMLNVGVGYAGASPSSGMVSTTGFNSSNTVLNSDSLRERSALNVANRFNTLVHNTSAQGAFTGPAMASENTEEGGAVLSGDAANRNVTSTAVNVHSMTPTLMTPSMPLLDSGSGSGSGQIGLTGADSSNSVVEKRNVDLSNKVDISNQYNTAVVNNDSQFAASGPATANRNTVAGGGVMSGNASNVESAYTMIDVSN